MVNAVTCDGATWAEGDGGRAVAGFSRIEVTTCSVRAARHKVARECHAALSEVEAAIARADRRVMREPWTQVREDCVRLAERSGEILQALSSLLCQEEVNARHPELQHRAADFAQGLEAWVETLAAGDAARACLCGERSVRPRLRELGDALAAAEEGLA